MSALTDYQTECQRLYHDANASFVALTEWTTYINAGRKKTAAICKCLRYLETSASANLTAAQETYSIATVSAKTTRAIDVLNISVIWGNQRIPLIYWPWTAFNARIRVWTSYQGRPGVWSRQGASIGTVFIGPVPDQTYSSEWDIAYLPVDLVDGAGTADELIYPFTEPVAYYACYLAKRKEQSYGEAEVFKNDFMEKCRFANAATYTRFLTNAYGSQL